MCLKVYCYENTQRFNDLVPSARALGSVFQKVNFLRDLKDDFEVRGRQYFPGVDLSKFNAEIKAKLIHDIKLEFEKSKYGIRRLNFTSRLGVFLAYSYYKALLHKIEIADVKKLSEYRLSINNIRKIAIYLKCVVLNPFLAKFN